MQLVNLEEDPSEANPKPNSGKIANELTAELMRHIQKSGKITWKKP